MLSSEGICKRATGKRQLSSYNAYCELTDLPSDGATYSYETESILERTKELSDEVRNGSLDVLAAFSGLRPSREGGTRVEREDLTVAGQKRTVVHNYGAGGTGFQAGYGMALDAVRAAEPVLSKLQTELKSKL